MTLSIDRKRIYFLFTLLSTTITICLGIRYIISNEISILFYTLLSLLLCCILWCFNNIEYYIIHLIFYITIFIFLVSRPTIDYFKTGALSTYQGDVYKFSFLVVIISIIGLHIGSIITTKRVPLQNKMKNKNMGYIKKVRLMALVIFGLSYPFYVLRLVERLLFRLNTTYYDYYANFKSELPYFTYILSSFMLYSLCIYLATKPRKLYATLVLLALIFANAIHLLIGTRNPFILSLLFAFVYYFMRNQGERGLWIGFKEKLIIYIGTPVLMIIMGILNYVRDNVEVAGNSFSDIFLDFIYKQGTSFGVLAHGYLYNSNLPVREVSSYTFGPIIEYFTKGNIGVLFGGKAFEHTTNSTELALKSNSYAHNISYITLKEKYLDGHGIGSSYIMELYTDFGFIGVFVFSILLGVLFVLIMKIAYSDRILLFGIGLFILNNLFFMPRSSFSESFLNLFTMQFWGIIAIIFFGAKTMTKKTQYTTQGEEN
ncbi:O-antigen polysaccharide polymerase Wzy family protein [Gemella bergeri]